MITSDLTPFHVVISSIKHMLEFVITLEFYSFGDHNPGFTNCNPPAEIYGQQAKS